MRLSILPLFLLTLSLLASPTTADDWPQWRGEQRDGVWREEGVTEDLAQHPPTVLWRTPVGPGYSGPTVADGRVFVSDRPDESSERVLCLDAATGKQIWAHQYPCEYRISYTAGPRASVTIDGSLAYSLGAMGDLFCLQAASGEVVWRVDVNQQFSIEGQPTRMPIWGLAAAPLIDQDLVILHIGGRDGACLVALDKTTGKLRWKALDDQASYSAPVLMQRGQRPILIAWTGDSLSGLLPQTGEVLWSIPMPPSRMPIGIATPVIDGDRVYVTSFYDGSLMIEVSADGSQAKTVWRKVGRDERNTEALHSIISTPVMFDDHVYGVDSYGELRCLKADSGERVWEDLTLTPKARWSTVHFVRRGDQFWMLNERGELVLGELSPQGFKEIGRSPLIDPTLKQLRQRGGVVWSHPAFANRCVFARNDKELVCASLAAAR